MSAPVFCVNCRHYLLLAPDSDPLCGRTKKPPVPDFRQGEWLVSGSGPEPKPPPPHFRCSTERGSLAEGDCGPEGKFYAERKAA